jgi:hypothetical protein
MVILLEMMAARRRDIAAIRIILIKVIGEFQTNIISVKKINLVISRVMFFPVAGLYAVILYRRKPSSSSAMRNSLSISFWASMIKG